MRIGIRGSLSQAVNKRIRASARKVSTIVAKAWMVEVNRSPISNQAKSRYTKAIKPYNTVMGAYISDYVARLLETGWESFDMKPGFLKATNYARVPVDGKVRTVSNKSARSAWIHPGFRGANAIERTKKKLMARMGLLIEEALK